MRAWKSIGNSAGNSIKQQLIKTAGIEEKTRVRIEKETGISCFTNE
jgi:hypothetical protein